MDDALSLEELRVAVGIGDVIAMGEKNISQAAPGREALGKTLRETRCVRQPIAVRMADEIAGGAIGLG